VGSRQESLSHGGGEEGDLCAGNKEFEDILAAGVCSTFPHYNERALRGMDEEVSQGADSLSRALGLGGRGDGEDGEGAIGVEEGVEFSRGEVMRNVVSVDLDCCCAGAAPECSSICLSDDLREMRWRRRSQGELRMRS